MTLIWTDDDKEEKMGSRMMQARITDDVARALTERHDGQAEGIRMSLGRYFALLAFGRDRLKELFTENELSAVIDANNGWISDDRFDSPRYPHLNALDALDGGLVEKWKIEQPALFRLKLEALGPVEAFALTDLCERWWRCVTVGVPAERLRHLLDGR